MASNATNTMTDLDATPADRTPTPPRGHYRDRSTGRLVAVVSHDDTAVWFRTEDDRTLVIPWETWREMAGGDDPQYVPVETTADVEEGDR